MVMFCWGAIFGTALGVLLWPFSRWLIRLE